MMVPAMDVLTVKLSLCVASVFLLDSHVRQPIPFYPQEAHPGKSWAHWKGGFPDTVTRLQSPATCQKKGNPRRRCRITASATQLLLWVSRCLTRLTLPADSAWIWLPVLGCATISFLEESPKSGTAMTLQLVSGQPES